MKRASAAALALVLACSHHTTGESTPDGATVPQPSSPTATSPPSQVTIDAIARPEACTLGYRGAVLDLGDPSTRTHYGTKLESAPIEVIEREGATWARVRERSLAVDFYARPSDLANGGDTPEDRTGFIQARVRGGAAKSVNVFLDGKLIGSAPLTKGEARVVAVRSPSLALSEGVHEILLRFVGGVRATSEALAEVDWLHLGTGEPDERYAAPTRAETLVSANLAGQPVRALSLRAPGFARCVGWIPAGGTVEVTPALAGPGEADAQVRLVRDRAPPAVLATVHITAGDCGRHSWLVGDLGSAAGAPGALELVTIRASKGARVLFGDPRILGALTASSPATPPTAPARGLVLVVLGEVATQSLAIYGGARPVTELSALAASGVTFESHRATTGLAAGALASMLTGLPARSHTLDGEDGRLPRSLTTIAEAARQAGIVTALFTANPTTGIAFGFDRGWSTFAAHSPTEDAPATKVFDDAAEWIDLHKRESFLVVVHARGGHPPWDVTPDQLKSLDPPNYTGGIDAKHAAELLAHTRRSPGSVRYGDADRARAWALYSVAIDAHDVALGRLVAAVRAAGRDTDTAFIVTGDVGLNDAAHIPFAEAESLDEAALWVPLVIRRPGPLLAGTRVTTPTAGEDIARTIMGALGLAPPAVFQGLDLWDAASHRTASVPRPAMATIGERFALRWGGFVLSGQKRRETKLCDLSLEPACLADVRASYPLAVELLHAAALDAFVAGSSPPPREPATVDASAAAALRAWGL